jgi:hypothetical protein
MSSLLLSKVFIPEITANIISFITATFEDYRYIRTTIQDSAVKEYYDLACPLKAPYIIDCYSVGINPMKTTLLNTPDEVDDYNRNTHKHDAEYLRVREEVFHLLTVLPDVAFYVGISGIIVDADAMIRNILTLSPGARLQNMHLTPHGTLIGMRNGDRIFQFTSSISYVPPTASLRQLEKLYVCHGCPDEQMFDLSCCDSLTEIDIRIEFERLKGLALDRILTADCIYISPDIASKLVNIEKLSIRNEGHDVDLSSLPTGSLTELSIHNRTVTKMFSAAPVLRKLILYRSTLPQFDISIAPQLRSIGNVMSEGLVIDQHPSLYSLTLNATDSAVITSHPRLTKLDAAARYMTIESSPSLKYISVPFVTIVSSVQPSIRRLEIKNWEDVFRYDNIAEQVFGAAPYEYIEGFGYVHALNTKSTSQ